MHDHHDGPRGRSSESLPLARTRSANPAQRSPAGPTSPTIYACARYCGATCDPRPLLLVPRFHWREAAGPRRSTVSRNLRPVRIQPEVSTVLRSGGGNAHGHGTTVGTGCRRCARSATKALSLSPRRAAARRRARMPPPRRMRCSVVRSPCHRRCTDPGACRHDQIGGIWVAGESVGQGSGTTRKIRVHVQRMAK